MKIKMPLPTSAREHDEYEVHGGFYRNVRSTDSGQLRRAYGDRLEAFARARQAHDPEGRPLNPYLGVLLGLDQGSTTRRPRPATPGAIR